MTFDDWASIESWGKSMEFFRRHGIRATFFSTRPNIVAVANAARRRGLRFCALREIESDPTNIPFTSEETKRASLDCGTPVR